MQIAEPMTMLTDYLLAGLCAVLGWRLWTRSASGGHRSVGLLAGSLFSTALGAVTGGTSHGLALVLGPAALAVLWKVTVYSIGMTAFLFLAAVAWASLAGRWRQALLAAAVLQLAVYSLWMIDHDDFVYVIYDYVPAMLVVLGLKAWRLRQGSGSAPWLIAGILVSFVGAGIQQSGLSLHRHFNANDLYHLVQMFAVWLLYRGGCEMRDL